MALDKIIDVEFNDIDTIEDEIKYVVIQAKYRDQWVFARHKERQTWEIAGGHIEDNETADQAASRELFEETGATEFELVPLCEYTVVREGNERSSGRLYYALVHEIGELQDFEMAEIMFSKELPDQLTYKNIQGSLFKKVLELI